MPISLQIQIMRKHIFEIFFQFIFGFDIWGNNFPIIKEIEHDDHLLAKKLVKEFKKFILNLAN